jgi:hypothetical protein
MSFIRCDESVEIPREDKYLRNEIIYRKSTKLKSVTECYEYLQYTKYAYKYVP